MDSALGWISLTMLSSGISVVAVVLHYVQTNEVDYVAFAIAIVFGGYSLELGMANGYLSDSGLFNTIVGSCVVFAAVAGVIGIKRQQSGFQILHDDTR